MIGSLAYLMNCSRPNLAFSVNRLKHLVSCPTESHMLAVKHVLRYLPLTSNTHLTLDAPPNPPGKSIPMSPADDSLHSLHKQGWFDISSVDDTHDRCLT